MNIFQLPRVDSDLTVFLVLDGQEYEVSQFNINFNQQVDYKGQPQDEVRGGKILVGLTQILSDNIYSWAMKSITKNG